MTNPGAIVNSAAARQSGAGGLPALLADLLIVTLGVWACYSQIVSQLGASFDQLLGYLWLPGLFIITLCLWMWRSRAAPSDLESTASENDLVGLVSGRRLLFLLALLVPVAAGYWNDWGWVLWGGSACYFGLLLYSLAGSRAQIPGGNAPASRRDLLALLIFFVVAAGVSLIFSRANHDDGYYLNAIVSAMDHSQLPVLAFDGMHDNLELPTHLITQKRQTYELLIATIATLTGVAAWAVYYLMAPVFFSAFIGIANWLLLKRWAGDSAWLGLLFVLLILLVWDAGGRSFGLSSFTMLYPGKIVMLTVLIPLIIHYTFGVLEFAGLRSWLLLFLAQAAALSVSSSGSYVGALASGLVLLVSIGPNRNALRSLLLVGAALLPNLLILTLNWLDIQSIGGLGSEGKAYGPIVLFGDNLRGLTAFLAFLLVPLIALLAGSRWAVWLVRYIALAVLIIFNPLVIALLEAMARLLTWRTMWAVPVPALLAVGAVCALGLIKGLIQGQGGPARRPALAGASAFIALMIAFVVADKPTVAGSGVFVALGQPKVYPTALLYARHINEAASENDLVLAPKEVAVVLAGLNSAPNQLIVRPLYIDHMQMYWSPEEARARKALQEYVTHGGSGSGQRTWFLNELRERSVDVVVFMAANIAAKQELHTGLVNQGFQLDMDGPAEVWIRRADVDAE
jgi:hypothetical protein